MLTGIKSIRLHRRTLPLVGVAAIVLSGTLVASCGAHDSPVTVRASNAAGDKSDQLTDGQIVAIAKDAGVANGDSKATIEWVRTTYAKAYALNEGVDKVDEDERPVVMIQLHGTFENDSIGPRLRKSDGVDESVVPHASIVRVTVDAVTGESRIFNFTSHDVDLKQLGSVERPAGDN